MKMQLIKTPQISEKALVHYGEIFADYADSFRKLALVIDTKPDAICEYTHLPAIRILINNEDMALKTPTLFYEALGYGDPGVLLAAPGPSISGLMLDELGTFEQKSTFYQYIAKHNSRTFFAITEPHKGSDAGNMTCELLKKDNDTFYLKGEKYLIGNGAVGDLGVVIARISPGPLGIRAVLLTPEQLNLNHHLIVRQHLPMTGLRGAQLAYLQFNHCLIAREQILGVDLSPMQNGMLAVIKTFNRMRTGIGALALGQTQALLDYYIENKMLFKNFDKDFYNHQNKKLQSTRQLLQMSVNAIEIDPFQSHPVSMAKLQAVNNLDAIVQKVFSQLIPEALLCDEWLGKFYRDSFAWEYMEGTSHMLKKDVMQYLKVKQYDMKKCI